MDVARIFHQGGHINFQSGANILLKLELTMMLQAWIQKVIVGVAIQDRITDLEPVRQE